MVKVMISFEIKAMNIVVMFQLCHFEDFVLHRLSGHS
jgi:hypothetical protein